MVDENPTMTFDWDDARIFLAAYRNSSLLGAAKSLELSHSTVRRRLAGLEATLGTPLFTATTEGLKPTDAAEAAFSIAEHVEAAALAFGARLVGDARELEGSLVVTIVDGLSTFIAPIIASFVHKYPNIAITLNTENRMLDLSRREADVALRLTNTPDERLFGRRVGRVDYAPFASPSLVKRYGNNVSGIPWILWDEASRAVGTEAWYRQVSGGRPPAVRVTNAVALLALANSGVGGAVLPISLAKQTSLIQLDDPIDGFETDLWCLCHSDLRHSDRVRRFMDQVVEEGVGI